MIEKIKQEQIDANSVGKLSTRPNAPSAMGGNGLDAAQLRARFDALAKLAIDKINELLAYLNGDELKDGTTAPSFASLIKFTGDDGVEYTLEGILEALQNGEFFPVDTNYNPGSNYPQSGKAVSRVEAIAKLYADAQFSKALGLYESVAEGLESAEQRIEEVDQQSQQRTERAKQELVDYVEEALKDIDVDVQVSGAIGAHNINPYAHQDIRSQLGALRDRINAALNSDDTSLDQLKEIVAYIKSNKSLIDAITTSKVSVDAIVDNLSTNDSKKVLSAKQGMVLKQEIDGMAAETAYNPESTKAQSGKAVAQAIAAIPKEVHNITSIDNTYETVDSLPKGADNGTTYLVNENQSLYAYNGQTGSWEFKAKLKAHTLYCVLTGEKAGLYRYTMAAPYLLTVESHTLQEAKDYTDAKITQEAGESETLVMSQKAVTELVADALGNGTPTYETVQSVDEMTDTTKQYVLASTGTVWTYTTKEVFVEHNAYDANTAVFNTRLNGSGGEQAFNGAVVMGGYIDQAYDENCIVTFDGFESLSSIWGTDQTTASLGIAYYDSNKNFLGIVYNGSFGKTEWADLASPISFSAFKPTDKPDAAKNAVYVKVYVCLKYQTSISATDCENLVINFSTKNGYQKVSSWEDTGVVPTYKTVNSVEEMTDTTKRYVLASTGTVWAYTEETIAVEKNLFYPSDSETRINKRIIASGYTNQSGAVTTNYLPYDYYVLSKKDTTEKFMVKFSNTIGENIFKTGYNTFVYFYGSDISSAAGYIGWNFIRVDSTVRHAIETDDEGNVYIDPTSATAWMSKPAWDDVKYIRFIFNPNGDQNAIDLSDIEDIEIFTLGTTEYVTEGEWKDTGLSPTNYATLLTKINENTAQIHELDKRVTAIESESGTVTIPSYWEETVAEKIKAVQALQEEGGADCFSFVWASDTHCSPKQAASGQYSTSINVGKLANRLMNDLNIPFLAVTGDLSADIGIISDPSIDKTDIDAFFDAIVLPVGKERVLLTLGNHDGTTYTSPSTNDKVISKATRFNWFMRPFCDDNKRIWGGGEYYYVDYPQGKIRFIALCSNNGTENIYRKNHYDGNQLKWLAEEALIAPKGYTVVVLSHFPSNGTEAGGSPTNSDVLMAILTAFDTKNNYSGSADGVSISANYSNSDAILCGFFAGHIHNDTIDDTSTSFPIITVDTAGNKTEVEGRTFKNGSTTETAFDVVSINKASRTIYLTRIGVGTDRYVEYMKGDTQ